MFKSLSTLGAIAAIAVGTLCVSQADEPELNPQPGVLVLQSGRVLRGGIIRVGDRYIVTLGEKDEVGVPADIVEMRCETLEQAYELRKNALPIASTTSDHLTLGDWCIQYGLISAAAEQLMAVMEIAPDDPQIKQFEKRLKLAVHRSREPSVRTVGATQEVSQAELDRVVRTLPDGVVEQFTSSVQPLLLNRCSNGGCHGPNSDSDFQLVRPSWSRTLPRRFTQRNLYASLTYVNAKQPRNSDLLVKSISAHGGTTTPILGDRDTESLQLLASWVHRVSQGNPAVQPAVLHSPQALLLQPSDAIGDKREPERFPTDEPVLPISESPAPNLTTPGDTRVANSDNSTPSRDPFDPELFNRKYLKRRP
jgi:hypothetical protein